MDKKRDIALSSIVLIGILGHYYFGYFAWDVFVQQYEIIDGVKVNTFDILFGLSLYFCMDVLGLALFVVSSSAKANLMKWVGAGAMLISTIYFYMEFNHPHYWRVEKFKWPASIALTVANLFMLWYFIDLLRNKKFKN